MSQPRIEVQGIAGRKNLLIGTNFQAKFSLQYVNKFDAGMLVHADFFRRHGVEICVVGIEFAIGGQKVERFEIEGQWRKFRCFGKAQALFSTHQGEGMFLALIAEEMIKANTEN
jgi:hypothetical protein